MRNVMAHTPAGQQEVQRKLQGDEWCRLPHQGSAGRRQAGDDAGRWCMLQKEEWRADMRSYGTRPARSDSNLSASPSTAVPTAACSSTTSTNLRASTHWTAGGTSSWCRRAPWTRRASHSYVPTCEMWRQCTYTSRSLSATRLMSRRAGGRSVWLHLLGNIDADTADRSHQSAP